jgi:hypothetical protein
MVRALVATRADLHATLLGEPVVAARRATAHYRAHSDGEHRDREHEAHPTLFRLNALMIAAWVGFAVGLFVVIGTLFSVVGTLVVPRSFNSRI